MFKNPICGRKKSKKKNTKEEEEGDSKINEVKPDLQTIDIDTSKLTAGLYLEAKSKQTKFSAMQQLQCARQDFCGRLQFQLCVDLHTSPMC